MQFSLPYRVSPEVIHLDPTVWECPNETCTVHLRDVDSIYRHKNLEITMQMMVTGECMSPEFNRATQRALGQTVEGYDGDRRSFATVFFDEQGRLIGPRNRWTLTSYLRRQLSSQQLERSDWEYEEMLREAFAPIANLEIETTASPPRWIAWSEAQLLLRSGNVETVYLVDDIMFGLQLEDGSAFIGTIPVGKVVQQEIEECGEACTNVFLVVM